MKNMKVAKTPPPPPPDLRSYMSADKLLVGWVILYFKLLRMIDVLNE